MRRRSDATRSARDITCGVLSAVAVAVAVSVAMEIEDAGVISTGSATKSAEVLGVVEVGVVISKSIQEKRREKDELYSVDFETNIRIELIRYKNKCVHQIIHFFNFFF